MSVIPFASHYLECDAEGCDETFVMVEVTQTVAEVRRAASRSGWTVVSDMDFCSGHEQDDEP